MRGYVSEYGTCGDCSVAHKSELIEILEFTHFFEHFTFDKTDYSERGKHMKKYIRVVVAVELVTVGAKIELFIVKYKCRKLQTKNVGRCNYIL